jgi:hypothetical protein
VGVVAKACLGSVSFLYRSGTFPPPTGQQYHDITCNLIARIMGDRSQWTLEMFGSVRVGPDLSANCRTVPHRGRDGQWRGGQILDIRDETLLETTGA